MILDQIFGLLVYFNFIIGVLAFYLFFGVLPFDGETDYLTFERILHVQYQFPENVVNYY